MCPAGAECCHGEENKVWEPSKMRLNSIGQHSWLIFVKVVSFIRQCFY
jgi:hypothetical protein